MAQSIKKHTFLTGYKANFESVKRAASHNDLAMVECFDTRVSKKVAVIAAVFTDGEGMINMAPFAIMCEGNPYEYLQPPDPDGGFHPIDK